MGTRKKQIFQDAGIYALGSYAAQLVDLLNGILIRRFLGPSSMGVWAFLQVILNYAKHASLGVTAATGRDVPYYRGKGELVKAEEVKNLVFSFTLVTAVVTGLAVALFAWMKRADFQGPLFWGLLTVATLIVLQRLYNLFIVLLRAHKDFSFASLVNFLSSVITLAVTIVLTWRFQLYGFLAGTILGYVLLLLLLLIRTHYRFAFYFSYKPFVSLLSLGLAVLISDLLRTVLLSIDRILITKYLGFEALGFYSVALMASNYLYALPNMLGIVFFPHFQEVFAKRDRVKDLENLIREPSIGLSYLFPFLIGIVWISASWLVPLILPEFTPGVTALKYLSLGAFFLALTHPFSMFIITIRRHWHLIPLMGVAVIFGLGITWMAIQWGGGIEGVALASVATACAYFMSLSWVSLREIYSIRASLLFYGRIFLIFCYFTGCLLFVDRLGDEAVGLAKMAFQFSIFALLVSPFLLMAEKEVGAVSLLKDSLREFRKRRTNAKALNADEKVE